MSKTTVTEFGCDESGCEKKVTDSKFPYEQGWQYVYDFEAKLSQEVLVGKEGADAMTEIKTIKIKDKHFCSQAHLIEYMTRLTNKGQ